MPLTILKGPASDSGHLAAADNARNASYEVYPVVIVVVVRLSGG